MQKREWADTADLDKANQTIDDYLESLRNEPECKRKKGRVRIAVQTGIYLIIHSLKLLYIIIEIHTLSDLVHQKNELPLQ